MKRPLAHVGFTLFSVLLCLVFVDSTAVSVALVIAASVLFALSLIIKKLRQSLILPTVMAAVISGCLLFLCFQAHYNNTLTLCGDNKKVEGVICESPCFSRENERYYCVMKVNAIGDKKISTKMRLSFSESVDGIDHDDFEIGDKVSFNATVYPMGSYNSTYKTYYKSQKIYLGAYSVKNLILTEGKNKPISYYIDALRDKVSENFLHDFDNPVASLLIAVLTGDKSFMDDGTYDDFKESGVVHIMAVSGLHLTVWVTFLAFFLDLEGRKGKVMSALMIVFTVFMLNFASFTGSVKRAGMMTLLLLVGKILGKNADSLNGLGFAAVCVLCVNPFAVSDISFMLSFLSTLGIIVMGVPLNEKMIKKFNKAGETAKRLISPLLSSVAISISVSVFTLPVSVGYLGGVSLAAPITNLLFIFSATPLIILAGLYTFLRFVPFVSTAVALALKYLSLYMFKVAEFISASDLAYVYTEPENLKYWLTAVFVLIISAMILYKYKRKTSAKVSVILSVGLLVLSLGVNYYTSLDKCRITVFGSDGGNCVIVSINGQGVLIGYEGDSYSEETLTEETEIHGTKILGAVFSTEIITQQQKDICHSLGIENILTADGASVELFDKVTVTKNENSVTVKAKDIKTHIFYKEYLQESDSYDIITGSTYLPYGSYENNCAFSVGESRPFTVIVRSDNIEVGGESNWLNLMKKV